MMRVTSKKMTTRNVAAMTSNVALTTTAIVAAKEAAIMMMPCVNSTMDTISGAITSKTETVVTTSPQMAPAMDMVTAMATGMAKAMMSIIMMRVAAVKKQKLKPSTKTSL